MGRLRSAPNPTQMPAIARHTGVPLQTTERFASAVGSAWLPPNGWYDASIGTDIQADAPLLMAANGLRTASSQTYNGRSMWYRSFPGSSSGEVTVQMIAGLGQFGPLAFCKPGGTIKGIAFYWNLLFGRWYLVTLGNEYADRVIYDSSPVKGIGGGDEVDVSLRWSGTTISAYIDNVLVAGPVTVPSEIRTYHNHGFYMGQDSSGTASVRSVQFNLSSPRAQGSAIAHPVVAANGTPTEVASATSIDVPHPAGVQPNDLLVAFVAYGAGGTPTTPSGWTQIASGQSGVRFVAYYKVAVGDESGTNQTFSKSTGSASTAAGIILRVTGYVHVTGSAGITGGATTNTTTTSINAPGQDITGINALSLWGGALGSNTAITVPATHTLVAETGTAGQAINLSIAEADLVVSPNADSGTITGTAGAAVNNTGIHVVILPGVDFTPPP